jgi:hypothetical protein
MWVITSAIIDFFLVNHTMGIRRQGSKVWSLTSLLQHPLYASMMCSQAVIQLETDYAQCCLSVFSHGGA